MLSNIGNSILFISAFLSISIIYLANKNLKASNNLIIKNIYQLSLIQSTLIIVCFFTLITAFIVSDFSLVTVYQNSHSMKPVFYKIAGTWGNHEGSLLLWLLVLTLFILIFLLRTKKQSKNYRILTLLFQQVIIIGFFIFLLSSSNPFNFIYPTPIEGLGLNPILQDPALAIHPPVLYLGYVG